LKQKLMNTYGAIIILFAFMTVACTQVQKPAAEPKPEKPAQEQQKEIPEKKPLSGYFPLSQGNTWQYQGEGNEYASFIREVVFVKGNRAQIKEDNGGTVSASVFEVSEQEITRIFFQGEAYEEKNLLDAEPNDDLVILKAPLQVGTTWETKDGTREIVDINATVDTPAGRFDQVLKVKISHPDSTMYEYFKEGIGMVKKEFISGETKVTSSLEKYQK